MTPILGDISQVSALSADVTTIWTAVLVLGIGMIGYRLGKRVIGKF